jgi:hypothetical protein
MPPASGVSAFRVVAPSVILSDTCGPAITPLFGRNELARDIAGEDDGSFDPREFEAVPLDPSQLTIERAIQKMLDSGREACGDRRLRWLEENLARLPADQKVASDELLGSSFTLLSATVWFIEELRYSRSFVCGGDALYPGYRPLRGVNAEGYALLCRKKKT